MQKQITVNYTEREFRELIREEVKSALLEISQLTNQEANKDEFVNLDQAVEILGLSKSTIYKFVGELKIPFHKQGPRRLMFKKIELDKWLIDNRSGMGIINTQD